MPAVLVLGLAIAWNVTPLAVSYAQSNGDPAAHAAYWTPAITTCADI